MQLMQDTYSEVGTRPDEGLRPYFVCRTAGMPISWVAQLRSQRTLDALSTFLGIESAVESAREALAGRLHHELGLIADKSVRNRILQLRRDIFNSRMPRAVDINTCDVALPQDAWLAVAEHVELLRSKSELASQFAAVFTSEQARTRILLQRAVADDDFRRGLLASSKTLYQNVERYRRALPEATSSRDEQIERGLLRYFTRAAMKATPFATFCAVIPGQFHLSDGAPEGASALRLSGDLRRKRSFIRLNKSLLSTIWNHLKTRPAVRAQFVVELTPTLTTDGNTLRFLSNAEGLEVFQRLTTNEALDVIVPLLRTHSGTRLRTLVDALVQDSRIEASYEEVTAYLDQLIRLGLLRFRIGIADQDADWDIGLATFLDSINDSGAQAATEVLRALRAHVAPFAEAAVGERVRIAAEMHDRVARLVESWKVPALPSKFIVYHEDATADAEMHVAVNDRVATAFGRLGELVALMGRVAAQRPQQAALRHFFGSFYGSRSGGVPLLRFYEDFYREHFKEHLQRQRDAQSGMPAVDSNPYDLGNPFSLDCVAAWHTARAALTELWRTAWARTPNAVEITVSREDVEAALADIPPLLPCERSVGAFCELVTPLATSAQRAQVILKNGTVLTGRGKFFSRFLYMLPDAMRQTVFADNNSGSSEWRAEICADSNFNANLHPTLLKWEISYPTAESGGSKDQLLCSDLLVMPSPHDAYALQLVHGPTGTPVVPFDLGFLNPLARPPLFQLLSRFTPVADATIQLPDQLSRDSAQQNAARSTPDAGTRDRSDPIPDAVTEQATVAYRPRMTFEDSVVLSRRRWSVPSELFPRQARHEDDATYFLGVQRWRTTHGIPEQIYFRIRPSPTKRTQQVAGVEVPALDANYDASRDGVALPDGNGAVGLSSTELPLPVKQSDGTEDNADLPVAEPPAELHRGSRDFFKPQFVDFGSPLLVKLFAHAPGGLEHFMMFVEERFPADDQLPELDGERYVTEFVIQLDVGVTAPEKPIPTPA